jgi:tRNA A-37 threonylcarbamoyl transferase component Bud32
MADVYLAEHRHLARTVVIKSPAPHLIGGPTAVARFLREVRAMVPLSHPHVVRITDCGEHNGAPYAVLDYLAGGSLWDRLPRGQGGRRVPMPPDEVLRWARAVADALDYVHRQGFVHRDVKPQNVLFDAEGNAYLADFGIAKAIAGERDDGTEVNITEADRTVGTKRYMAPEVIRGAAYDGRADQYSLAVTVYEALTGKHPFSGAAPGDLLVKHCTEDWPPLAGLAPGLTREVEAAIRRAARRKAAGRYPTCAEFVATLAASLAPASPGTGAPAVLPGKRPDLLRVHCPGCRSVLRLPREGLGKRLRCKVCEFRFGIPPAADAGAGSVPGVAGTGPANGSTASPGGPVGDAGTAVFEEMIAEPPNPPTAQERALRADAKAWPGAQLPKWVWGVAAVGLVFILAGVGYVAWRATRPAAVVGPTSPPPGPTPPELPPRPAPKEKSARFAWDRPFKPGPMHTMSHKDEVLSVAVFPDGKRAVCGVGGRDADLHVWDLETGERDHVLAGGHRDSQGKPNRELRGLAVSPDGAAIASGDGTGLIVVWDAASRKAVRTFKSDDGAVWWLAFTPDGKRLLSTHGDVLTYTEVATGTTLKTWSHPAAVRVVRCSADGKTAFTSCLDGHVRVIDLDTSVTRVQLRLHAGPGSGLAVRTDGTHLVSSSSELGQIVLVDLRVNKLVRRFTGDTRFPEAVELSPAGRHAVSVGKVEAESARGGYVALWDLATGTAVERWSDHARHVHAAAFTPNGKRLLTASTDGTLRMYSLPQDVWDPPGPPPGRD